MPEQLTFNLPVRTALGRDDFFVAPSNKLALQALENWQDWPLARAVLVGAPGAGKTHLARVFQQITGAVSVKATEVSEPDLPGLVDATCLVVEDINRIVGNSAQEQGLFHLLNMAQSSVTSLLLTSTLPPARLSFVLPDLKSRLNATQLVSLDAPDDSLLAAMLVKQFSDRQLVISHRLIPYLLSRMDRSAAAVGQLVDALDSRALAEKRPLSRALAREVLDKL